MDFHDEFFEEVKMKFWKTFPEITSKISWFAKFRVDLPNNKYKRSLDMKRHWIWIIHWLEKVPSKKFWFSGVQLSLVLLASCESDSGDPLDWLRNAVPGEPGVDYPILASIQVRSLWFYSWWPSWCCWQFCLIFHTIGPLFGGGGDVPSVVAWQLWPNLNLIIWFWASGDEFHLRRPCHGRLLCRSRAGLPGLPCLSSGYFHRKPWENL